MRRHSRSKNGVLSHAYDPRIHDEAQSAQDLRPRVVRGVMDGRVKPAMTGWSYSVPEPKGSSARRRRGIDQFRIDRLQSVAPGELVEVDRAFGRLLALRPAAQAAEVVIVHLVDRKGPRVGVPLILC